MMSFFLCNLSHSIRKLQSLQEVWKRIFFFQMMFLALPASVILIILRVPATRLVYGASRFPWEATLQTALILGIFSVSRGRGFEIAIPILWPGERFLQLVLERLVSRGPPLQR